MISYTIELHSDGTYSFNKSSKPLLNRQQLEEQNEELHQIIHDYAKIIKEFEEENPNGKLKEEFERRLLNLTNINKELIDENRKLKKENKQLKDKLDEILELTEEPMGMIHLRKAQIRGIIKGDYDE